MTVESDIAVIGCVDLKAQLTQGLELLFSEFISSQAMQADGDGSTIMPPLGRRCFIDVSTLLQSAVFADEKVVTDIGPATGFMPLAHDVNAVVFFVIGCRTVQEDAVDSSVWFLEHRKVSFLR